MLNPGKFVMNLALTGVIPTKTMTPYVPMTREEILSDVARALELGVQMVHLHARDAEGVQSSRPEDYQDLIEGIRDLKGGEDLIVCVTTSGRLDASFESRSRVLELDGKAKPDMASLTLSSLNFVQSASVNSPQVIRQLAGRMLERGIKPELEVFDLGMANFIHVLHKEGLLKPPFYVNVLLGNIAGGQANLLELAAILAALPQESIVCVAGIGVHQLKANTLGLLSAHGVRVGLEDNIWYSRQQQELARNEDLVRRVVELARILELSPEDRRVVRERLLGVQGAVF